MGLKLIKRGQIWHITGTVAGTSIRQSTGHRERSKAEAVRIRTEAQLLERHAFGKPARLTFAEAALTYLESGGEGRFFAKILEYFGPETLLSDVDNAAVNKAAAKLYPRAKASTINRQLITPISAVINMAADDGLCQPRRLKRRKPPAGRIRWLTPAEAERILGAADARLARMIGFLLGTGARAGEMLALDVADLDLEGQEVFLAKTKSDEPRRVMFPARSKRLLAAGEGIPEIGRVFLTPKGKPYVLREKGGGQIAEAFGQAVERAELGAEVTPHVCRHTWATWFWAHNKDLVQLMGQGGWATAKIALDYTKLAPARLAQDLFDHGWDFRIDTKSAQEIAAPTPNQLKVIDN